MTYNYNSTDPVKITLAELDDRKRFLLDSSQRFCMLPWIHLHAAPDGSAYPCCFGTGVKTVGSVKDNTLAEIWNDEPQRRIRINMLTEQPSKECFRCYEQEESGFFSGRRSANKHFGHHIHRIDKTLEDGTYPEFQMAYWDIRFSNLCNLRCRSCGHVFSSNWHKDQKSLILLSYWNNVRDDTWPSQPPRTKEEFDALPDAIKDELINQFGGEMLHHIELAKTLPVLNYAGRTETDMWEQLIPHLDYVEQVYFAGGEPLLMEEHYNILEELLKRGRTNVRLLYNTNFTHTDLKGQSVFEYWKQFEQVAVGASLDDSGSRGEYIRKGTEWEQVERNREDMMRICPEVDFYISPTLSIMNARHLPEFHRTWVEKGLIRAQDLNVNILQDPAYYRIDIATAEYKEELQLLYRQHIGWLQEQGDHLGRATHGFESAITFMNATDNTHLIDKFWRKTHELDSIRNENILDIIPELSALR